MARAPMPRDRVKKDCPMAANTASPKIRLPWASYMRL